jgi:LPXTG-motif cell wall-anchored protein
MRSVATFLLAAVLVCAGAAPAFATSGSEPKPNAGDTATWLEHQVNSQGFIPQATDPSKPNLSASAQAVTALASARAYKTTATALASYVDAHVDDFVVHSGLDDPGALAYVILADASLGRSTSTLVTRLLATQQPSGLFGAADPTFDGAFRQGLSLLALHAAGTSNPAGVAWLEGQQCADGLWTSFRGDTATPCPAVDPVTFAGPDTNSSALAVLGLIAQGVTSVARGAITALDAVRNAGGGWGFLASRDQATDANSTGLVVSAIRTVTGASDARGLAALSRLVVGCTGASADMGGVAFQPGTGGKLVPDVMATVQALPAISNAALPLVSVTFGSTPTSGCAPPTSTTTTPVTVASASSTTTTVAPVAAAELPRTGSSSAALVVVGVLFLATGLAIGGGVRRRRVS